MTPSIDDIRRDDELLDTLGQRRAPHRPDAAADALAGWVREIDAPAHAPAPGRYARSRHTRTRVGVVAAITVATLSISGVAAAVGGMPGISSVAQQLGFVHRSSEFGSGAAGPTSTSAASTAAASTTTSDVATYDVTTQTSTSTSALPPRVLPGALRRASAVAEQTHHPTPSITSTSTTPSSTSTPSSSSSTTSTKPSSTPSSTATSTTEPSPTSTRTKRPPTPRPTHTRTTPGWGPISPTSTPSSTGESSTTSTGTSTTP